MVANTNSNSSPPLRGRGLLANDDKCSKCGKKHNHLLFKHS